MECNKKNCPTEGSFLCCHNITYRSDNSLEERFSDVSRTSHSKTGYRMTIEEKICQNIAIHLGNNCYESDIKTAVKTVMKRDWDHLERGQIGQIVIPKQFLSKYPEVIDLEKFVEKVQGIKEKPLKSPKEEQLLKKLKHIRGERTEKKVYKALKRIFKRLDEDVLIIHGLKFMALTDQDKIEDFEKDFLIINLTRRYTMSLEVKACLSTNSLKGAKKQTNGTKRLIDEWLGATFTQENGWRFIGVMYFDEKAADYHPVFCSDCDQHIMIGSDQLESRFESILTKLSIKEASGTAKEEFLEAIEYILFFAAFEPVITSSTRFSKRVAKNLNIAGCAENIELWRAWTPNQQILVKSNVQKVIFISAPSTGKTTLMTEEAYYLGSKSEKAAFFIPSTFGANRNTLLALSMQHQFQNYFEVCSVKRRTKGIDYKSLLGMLQNGQYPEYHIFIDEIHIESIKDIEILKDIANICAEKTLWMSITSMKSDVSSDFIRSEFGNEFFIPDDLIYPLRNSPSIVKYAYSEQEDLPLSQPNEIQKVRVTSAPYSIRSPSRTNVESKIVLPRDLCDGEDVLTIKDNEKLMKLKTEVMVSVYHEEQVLVVVLDNTDTLIEQVQKKFPSDNTITYFGWKPKKMKPRSTNGQGTLKKLFRVDTWFPRYRNEPSEEAECLEDTEVLNWISGNSTKKFLITDEWTVAGYEFDTMILIAYDHQMRDISSVCQRAKARLIVYQIDKLASEAMGIFKKVRGIYSANNSRDGSRNSSLRSSNNSLHTQRIRPRENDYTDYEELSRAAARNLI